MFKIREVALPVFISVALALYVLLTRYLIYPTALILICGTLLTIAYFRIGRTIKVPHILLGALVVVVIVLLNLAVFVAKVHAERVLVYFLTLLILVRSFSLCRLKDYSQLMFLSVLCLLAGGSYNPPESFSIIIVFYTVIAGYAIYKFHLVGEYLAHCRIRENSPTLVMATSKRAGIWPFLRSTIGTCLAALIIFALIPRQPAGWNLIAGLGGKDTLSTGFSQQMRLGELGKTLQDFTPVLRVRYQFDENQKNKSFNNLLYLRGVVYGQYVYQDKSWQWMEDRTNDLETYKVSSSLASPIPIQTAGLKHDSAVLWRISFEHPATTNLFVIDRPLAIAANNSITVMYNPLTNILSGVSSFVPTGFVYQLLTEPAPITVLTKPVSSRPAVQVQSQFFFEPISEKRLSHDKPSVTPTPAVTSRPADYRVVDIKSFEPIARKILSFLPPTASIEERARTIESWFKSGFEYSLDNRDVDPKAEPIMDFLTRRKRGHCEYFASAMTLLARSVGMKARVVGGYKDGIFNSFGNYYIVRNCDAHSWVEVYVPGYGWKRFDPTPPGREDFLREQQSTTFKWFWDIVDLMQYNWTDRLANYERNTDRNDFMKSLQDQILPGSRQQKDTYSLRGLFKTLVNIIRGKDYESVWLQLLHCGLVLFILVVVAILLRIFYEVGQMMWGDLKKFIFRRWEQRFGAMWYCPIDFYRRILLWLATRGISRSSYETADEFADRVSRAHPRIEKSLHIITKVYLAVRFGNKKINSEQKAYLNQLSSHIQEIFANKKRVPVTQNKRRSIKRG